MVKIYTTITEEGGDLCEIGFPAINSILARVILESTASDDESRVREDFMRSTRLFICLSKQTVPGYAYIKGVHTKSITSWK